MEIMLYILYINNMYIFFLGLEGVLIVLIFRDLWGIDLYLVIIIRVLDYWGDC